MQGKGVVIPQQEWFAILVSVLLCSVGFMVFKYNAQSLEICTSVSTNQSDHIVSLRDP